MSYKDQFYNEGFATTFYLKPVKFVNKKIKNKKIAKILCIIIKLIYTLLAIAFGIIMFIIKF